MQLAKQFRVSVDEIASSFSGNVLGIATFTYVAPIFTCIRVHGLTWDRLIQNALAVKYGHRLVYLLSTLFVCAHLLLTPCHGGTMADPLQMFVSCIWTALSPNLASLRASRVFQGFGEAAPKWFVLMVIRAIPSWAGNN